MPWLDLLIGVIIATNVATIIVNVCTIRLQRQIIKTMQERERHALA